MGKVEQWVNLEKDAKYVADGIPSKERLGELQYEVTFKKAALANFKVKVEPVGTPAAYTSAEKKRNLRFDVQQTSHQTNVSKKKIKIDHTVTLPAAGGNEFKVKAKFKKKVVEAAKTLEVRRKLFYQVMQMKGVTAATTTAMEQAFWNPGKNFYIKMKREGGVPNIPLMENLATDSEHNAFINESQKAFTLRPKGDLAFAIAYVNYIAERSRFDSLVFAKVNVGSRLFGGAGKFITVELDQHLWYGINLTDDKNKEWFHSIRVEFQEEGTTSWVMIPISEANCEVDTSAPDFTYGGHRRLRIELASAVGQNWFTRMKGEVRVYFQGFTAGWTNGFAYTDYPLIAMATKVVWRDQVAGKLAFTLNHEVGHMIGMVPDGNGLLPDQPPNYYVNKNHTGPHCEKGAVFVAKNWSGNPGCVMFGADGVWNAGAIVDAPSTFCGDCEKAVRKMDLHSAALRQSGWKNPL